MSRESLRNLPLDEMIPALAAKLAKKKLEWSARDVDRYSWIFRRGGGASFLECCYQRGLGIWETKRPGPRGGRPVKVLVFDKPAETDAAMIEQSISESKTRAL